MTQITAFGPAPRKGNDPLHYYRTSRRLIGAICELEGPFDDGVTWDPCCGDGRFGEEWERRGWRMVSSDITDRGYGTVANFMSAKPPADLRYMAFNPPFNLSEGFAEKAVSDLKEVQRPWKLCVLQRTLWMESIGRREMFERTGLSRVWVASNRHGCHSPEVDPDGDRDDGGMVPFSWFVWDSESPWPGYFETRLFETTKAGQIVVNPLSILRPTS